VPSSFEEFTDQISENVPEVRFAAPVAGAFAGLVAAFVEDLGQLTGQVSAGLTAAGATGVKWSTTLTTHSIAGGTKVKTGGARAGAVVSIRTPKPRRTAQRLNTRLGWMNDPDAKADGYLYSLARTYGESDLVLDIGVPHEHDLADKLEALNDLGRGVTMDVVLADFGVGSKTWRRQD
jgi:hypothetical protein